ncbi:MAG: S-layer homology domain-containing protein [Faecousia sp.]
MKKRIVSFLLVVTLLISLSPAVFAKNQESLTLEGTVCYSKAYEMLQLVNAERVKAGLPALTMDKAMLDTAILRAEEIAVLFSHTRPNGEAWSTAYPAKPYNAPYYHGENLSIALEDSSDCQNVLDGWMNSSTHRANILRQEGVSIGIGCFYHNGCYYWVQAFSSKSPEDPHLSGQAPVTAQIVYDPELVLDNGGEPVELKYVFRLMGSQQMDVSDTQQLSVSFQNPGWPLANAVIKADAVVWHSSDPSVLTVENGLVTAVSPGVATVTAYIGSAEKQLDIRVAGHCYRYVSNKNGTHAASCAHCGYAATEQCDTLGTNGACSKCGYFVGSENCNHVFVSDQNFSYPASCTEPQIYAYKCRECGQTDVKTGLPATNHSWSESKTPVIPTCVSTGLRTSVCTNCGTVQEEVLEALGHDYGEFVPSTAPTCTLCGYLQSTCSRCSVAQLQELAPLGHADENGDGRCDRCGIQISGCSHDWGTGTVTTAATYSAPGVMTYTCAKCGETKTGEIPALALPFVDVKDTDYFRAPVAWALDNAITYGDDETHFAPQSPCTREQVVTFLWRASGKPAPKSETCPFVDVKPTDYSYDAVRWAAEQGITMGTDETHFSPKATVTRAQFVSFLWRADGKPESSTENTFTDLDVNEYYVPAVLWAVEKQITVGTGDGKFSPDAPCLREQVVTFLYRDR